MLFYKINKQSRSSINYCCNYCNGTVFKEVTETWLRILLFDVYKISKEEYLKCDTCSRRLLKNEMTDAYSKNKTVTNYKDGTIATSEIIQQNGQQIKKVVLNTKNVIPRVNDPLLMAQTIIAIMEFAAKIDPRIDLENKSNYHFILDSWPEYEAELADITIQIQESSVEKGEELVWEYFNKAGKAFNGAARSFIVTQAVSCTRGQMFMDPGVENLFKKFLREMGYEELRLNSALMDFRHTVSK